MKHCKDCEYCRLDLVAQYVKGADIYKCDLSGYVTEPRGRACEKYKKNSFGFGGVRKWLYDWLCGHNE